MSTDLMIPSKADVPAYITNSAAARAANEDAAAGISTGFPPRIKLNGKAFTLVDGNGEEKNFPASKLIVAPDENTYLPVIVLRAKRNIQKQWFAAAFNPSEEGKVPDCFSSDGEKPDASALAPQCATCAACPQNAFGSGSDQNGNPTKGKACSDNKILAVFVPGFGIHSLKIPPASLKNFGLYVKQLSAASVPLGACKTLLGFDVDSSFPVLVFKFGGYIEERLMPKLEEMAISLEAEEIISGVIVSSTKALPTPPPAEPKPAPAAKKPKATPPPAEPVPATVDDLGLGIDIDVPPAAAASTPAPTPKPATQQVSDDDLARELGL